MMATYFDKFPTVSYNGVELRNILLKAGLAKELLRSYQHLAPYEIQQDDTITSLAYDYYGDVGFSWLVIVSAQIYDPFFSWPMRDDELDEALSLQYGSVDAARNTIAYYKNIEDGSLVNPQTIELLGTEIELANYQPVNAYDAAVQQNEKNRNILLLKREYAPEIAYQLGVTLRQ
jgi:hypothetical protein